MSDIYRINKAGLYGIGHYGVLETRIMIGQPDTCGCVSLSHDKLKELLDCLRINWEDGYFINDLLTGQMVAMETDEHLLFTSIGDPYGHEKVMLP